MTVRTFNRGGGTNFWNTNGNWSPSGVPGVGDDAMITSVGTFYNVSYNATLNTIATLTVSNGNTLSLPTANSVLSVSNQVNIDGGTIRVATSTAQLFVSQAVYVVNGGALYVDAGSFSANSVTIGTGVNDIMYVDGDSSSVTVNTAINVGGNLGGASGAGTLNIGAGLGGGVNVSAPVHLNSTGSKLVFDQAVARSFGAVVSGSGSVVKNLGGTTTLTASNTYTGTTTVNAGVLKGGALDAFGTRSAVTVLAGAKLDLGGFNQTIGSLSGAGGVTNSGASARTLTIDEASGGNVFFNGVIDNAGAAISLVKTGDGNAYFLNDANSYTGTTTVSQGILLVGGSGATGSIGTGAATIAANATLALFKTGNFTFANAIGGAGYFDKNLSSVATLTGASSAFAGTFRVGTGTLKGGAANAFGSGSAAAIVGASDSTATLDLGGFDATFTSLTGLGKVTNSSASTVNLTINTSSADYFDGTIDNAGGGALSLTKSGASFLYLTSDNNSYTGATNVTGGILLVGAAGATGSIGSGAASIAAGATLALFKTGGVSNAFTFANAISGAGLFDKNLSSTATLTGANSGFTGTFQVNAGTLKSGGATALGAGSASVNLTTAGATLDLNGNAASLAGLNGALGTFLTNSGAATSLTVTNALGASSYFQGVISNIGGAVSLVKNGAGVLQLSEDNTYSGGTTVNAGLLTLGAGPNKGSAGTGSITIASGARVLLFRSGNYTFANALVGAGVLETVFNGVATLTGANSGFSGEYRISAGTMKAGVANAFGAGGANANVAAGATVDLNGFSTSFASLAGAGTVANTGAGAITLTVGGGASSFSGVIANAISLSVTGNLTLSGANTYSGATTITSATLTIGAGGTSGAVGAGAIVNNGALTFNRSDATIVTNAISGTGLVYVQAGDVTLAHTNTFTGPIDLVHGAATLRGGAVNAFGAGNLVSVAAGNTLDLGGFDQTIGVLTDGSPWSIYTAGVITNNGGSAATLTVTNTGIIDSSFFGGLITNGEAAALNLVKTGGGELLLSHTNDYRGTTTVSGGTLKAGTFNAFGSNSNTTVTSGAVLDLAGFSQSLGTLSGAGTIINSDAANQAYLTINNATLADSTTFSGQIASHVSLSKAGAGTLTLTGVNTLDGYIFLGEGTLALSGAGSLNSATLSSFGGTFDISGIGAATASLASLGSGESAGEVKLGGKKLELTAQAGSFGGAITGKAGAVDALAFTLASGIDLFALSGTSFNTWDDATDTISVTGNALANTIYVSSHKDTTDGGGGRDTAVFGFTRASATILRTGVGAYTVTSGGVTHVLTNVEIAHFSDGVSLNLGKAVRDFGGDDKSDLLFRRTSDGVTYLWTMNNFTVTNGATTGTQVGVNWQIKGVADFDGDGKSDILWSYFNATNAADVLNGVSYITYQNGAATAAGGGGLVQQLPSTWSLVGTGDFNGDGMADVLYRNTTSGRLYLDIMNGAAIDWAQSDFTSEDVISLNWKVAAVADFSGDGMADVLWRYDNAANVNDALNGTLYEWTMNGKTVVSEGLLTQSASATWAVAGTGDFNGDGYADILFRNSASGETYIDFMNERTVLPSSASTQWAVDNAWALASIADVNGDGMSDLVWQNVATAGVYIWDMNGASVAAGDASSAGTGLGWTVQNGVLIG